MFATRFILIHPFLNSHAGPLGLSTLLIPPTNDIFRSPVKNNVLCLPFAMHGKSVIFAATPFLRENLCYAEALLARWFR